jgi:uncharacterized protein (TIRG00374 family)
MLLSHLENKVQTAPRPSDNSAADQVKPPVLSENGIQKVGKNRLIWGGLIFMGLTVGIFWYQFSEIPVGQRPPLWNQLQWRYLFWLLIFLPVETFAAGLRIWVIGRALQPGVSLWTCLKAEWANLGLAMLTPSQTGGGFGQIYMLSRGGMKLGTALTVSLISFLGSMVVLLIIGTHSLLIARIDHLVVFFQGAFLIFLLVFAGVIVAVCWPGSLRFVISGICSGIQRICEIKHSHKNIGLPQNSRVSRLTHQLHNFSEKLIDLCYMHQVNMRRFFSQDKSSFVWVCFLSMVFMLSRSTMAFLCLRFLGIQASGLLRVIETQLGLIFLIYFAPTPGSSGLAEGASMLMMNAAMSAGFVPYYNLLWRCSTLYLPAIAGLLFLLWAILKDASRAIGHSNRKRAT